MNNLSENHKTKLKLMKKLLLFSIIYSLLVSCASPRPITSKLNPNDVKSLSVFPHLSAVKIFNAKNEAITDPLEISNRCLEINENADGVISSFLDKKKIQHNKLEMSQDDEEIFVQEIVAYITLMKEKDLDSFLNKTKNYNSKNTRTAFAEIIVSDKVIEIIKKNNQRFALTTVTLGFTRTKKNEFNRKFANVGKAALAIGAVILTDGGLYVRSIPNLSNTYLILIDAQEKKLAMYIKKTEEFNPFEKEFLSEQVTFGLENYWIYQAALYKKKYGSK
jgi:hypothetical protein